VWEAALCAGKHGLSNLTVLVDYNKHQSYDSTRVVQDLEPLGDKWRSFGFGVAEVDGHDVDALRDVLGRGPVDPARPTAIVCHTVKGKGIAFAENNMAWHHKSRISSDEVAELLAALEGDRASHLS
jgi:transketolase